MSKTDPKVVVVAAAAAPDPPGLEAVAERASLRMVRSARALEEALVDADVVAVYDFNTTLLREVGPAIGGVEWIHAASAGVDAVLVPAVVEGRPIVTNARGVFEQPMAEWALAMLLAFAKDLPETLRLQREHTWKHRDTETVAGRHVVVVGAGSVGRAVGRLVRAVGMEVSGIAGTARQDDPDFDSVHGPDSLHQRLAVADDIVVCAPLTDSTRNLFDAEAFAAVKPGARFVNVGRGPIVDESALLEALRSGQISAAALDVFVDEPLPPDHPFWDMEQIIVSAHMSGDVVGWRSVLGRQFAENFARWCREEPLENVVDKQRAANLAVSR